MEKVSSLHSDHLTSRSKAATTPAGQSLQVSNPKTLILGSYRREKDQLVYLLWNSIAKMHAGNRKVLIWGKEPVETQRKGRSG
jgi:hypothetical protein